MSSARSVPLQPMVEGGRVAPIELFFDLVFVFALTQVTALMAADLTLRGLGRGLLVLALLWWSWVGYAWLANVVRADEGIGRVAVFAAMMAMFVLALSIPEAFDDLPGGLAGPVVVAVAYFAVRVVHLGTFWVVAGGDAGLRRQLLRFAPSVLGGTGLLLVASQLEGRAQTAVWAAALVVDYAGTMLAGSAGWRVRSAEHFAERHGLILIVALGESIVAIGVGVAALPISVPIVLASLLGLALAGSLWWAYFDVVALVAQRVLQRTEGVERTRMARDSYSYLHLPMIAGVALLAVGLKKVLEYVGDAEAHDLLDPLDPMALAVLFGGVSLYLLALVAFRYRNLRTVNVQRVAVAVALLAIAPVAAPLPALGALGLLTAVTVGLIGFEAVHFAEVRRRVRHDDDVAVSQLSGSGPPRPAP